MLVQKYETSSSCKFRLEPQIFLGSLRPWPFKTGKRLSHSVDVIGMVIRFNPYSIPIIFVKNWTKIKKKHIGLEPGPEEPFSDLQCKQLLPGFLVPALFGSRLHLLSEVCAFVLGNICERFARRDLC